MSKHDYDLVVIGAGSGGVRAARIASGHGAKVGNDEDMRLLTTESDATDDGIRATGIGWNEVAHLFDDARGRVVVLIDACHSGHVTRKYAVPNATFASALSKSKRAGVTIFAASKGRQASQEVGGTRGLRIAHVAREKQVLEGDGHGLFTGALLASLDAPATDRDGDGLLELSEIVDDVSERVAVLSHGEQTPFVPRSEILGDFAVSEAPKPVH